MSTGTDELASVAGVLANQTRLLAVRVTGSEPVLPASTADTETSSTGSPDAPDAPDTVADLELVRLARDLGTMARTALRLAVARAQADGHSWQQIGDVLGVSPQAACQRFGRRSEPADTELAPPVVTDAADRAITVLADWFEARYDAVVAAFDETLAGTFPVAGLAEARAHLTGRPARTGGWAIRSPWSGRPATTPWPTCRWSSNLACSRAG